MKHRIPVKFIAIALTALALFGCLSCGGGIIFLSAEGLYDLTPEEIRTRQDEDLAWKLAWNLARDYADRELAEGPPEFLLHFPDKGRDGLEYTKQQYHLDDTKWRFTIRDAGGVRLDGSAAELSNARSYTRTVTATYPQYLEFPPETAYSAYRDTDPETGKEKDYYFHYAETPPLLVTVELEPDAYRLESFSYDWFYRNLLPFGNAMIAGLVLCLLCFAAGLVYLCCAAGRRPHGGEIRPGGLNRVPLDFYAVTVAMAGFGAVLLAYSLCEQMYYVEGNIGLAALVVMVAVAACFLPVGFFFAVAAQVKMEKGYWWRHSVIGWCLVKIGHGIRFLLRGIGKLFSMLPVVWQWLLTAAGMVLIVFLSVLIANSVFYYRDLLALMVISTAISVCIGIICYGAYAYGTILAGARRMSRGNLDAKIPTHYLIGTFADCAYHLNALADAAVVAAREQMKSERMKTELITNVSHDIKTPLTSIINYVDLLQKPHTPEDREKYMEVLSRQSLRMKKLIEDLMEMSKASTGNLPVEITRVNAVEAVNQALGEFSDKLERARLTPVFCPPGDMIPMLADGRLAWRVLSNLLSNAVKYALPGTRVYLDVVPLEGRVLISIKNVSREQLTGNPQELMERFVRGDLSRNTEGSGLGLNIAKSLMELQGGQLQLLVDGDLFKVTLLFPAE